MEYIYELRKMSDIILKGGTRILRPAELEILIDSIHKTKNKTKFKALLYSGMRYVETRYLHSHPENFHKYYITVHSGKPKALQKERYVKLNNVGSEIVSAFLQGEQLPELPNWPTNLRRWAKRGGLNTAGLGALTTRKTWESYLVSSYPNAFAHIFLSQGHTETTSLQYYLGIPFTPEEKDKIKRYTEGWL